MDKSGIMKDVRLLIDYQTFHIQRFGGISRYFYEVVSHLRHTQARVALRFSMNQYIRHRGGHVYVPRVLFKVLEGVLRVANRRCSLTALRRGDFDVFHPTYYDPYFLGELGDRPFVLTIHDMTHERFPQYFSDGDRTAANKRLLAERAARVIAISKSTKRDIVEFLDIDEGKIDVIYHGLEPAACVAGSRPAWLPESYVLFVGGRGGYKNFARTVEAFAKVRRSHPELHLVLTGRPVSRGERQMFAELGVSAWVKECTDVSDEGLLTLYRYAELFVYPSLYEGFGIPILEAFSQDCPVALSDASCFPEVAGDAGAYFDAESAESQALALSRILDDAGFRQALVAKGRERLSLFTWDETARRTEETYRRALQGDRVL